jgi:LysM domain
LPSEWRRTVARYVAPLAFLAAVTLAVLLIRAGLNDPDATRHRAPSATSTLTQPPTVNGYYRIRAGDTLGRVADRFGTTVAALLALNPTVDPNGLRVGERIRVR